MNIVIFIIILLVLVVVHEFGHFFSAKKFGIRVDEFGFGFPPKIFGIKKGETEYSFNALPFGGFVKIFGENPDEESMNGPDAARSFINKAKWKQAIILFAGVFCNFLLAWLLFSIGFISGSPTSVTGTHDYELKDVHLVVVSVIAKSPAEAAGLTSGDKIVFIKSGNNSTTYISPDTVKSFVAPGKEIEIGYLRGGSTVENDIKITPENNNGKYSIGIAMDQIGIAKLSVFPAIYEGLKLSLSMIKGTVSGFYHLIVDAIRGKAALNSITGPVGLVGIVGDLYKLGASYLLSFAALISINLAVINLVPFPALDGGRLFFLLIEKIKGSPIKANIANIANMTGFALLILLMLVVTYHDVAKLL